MKYILEEQICLRKWKGDRHCFTISGSGKSFPLSKEEYSLLKLCDGNRELVPDDSLRIFELMHVIRRCGTKKEELTPGQIREYPNFFFRNIDWTITERCNYNCLHCFHAADNERHRAAFSKEEAFRMIAEAAQCGVTGIRLTGGEPTLHPHFREVVEEIGKQGLFLKTLITNGALLDDELIDFVKKLHPNVQIMLSFDGIGTHDWLRQHKGSEEQVKKTIMACKNAGLNVKINMNVNRRNRAVVFDSVKMLSDLGVNEVRLIKTTEAPRWQLNAADDSLTICEYYDLSAEFAEKYKHSGLRLPVTIWQSLYLNGEKELFNVLPVKASACRYDEDAPICKAMTNKISVQANGDIIPCAPLAGLYTLLGIEMGNVKRDGLQKLLTEGPLTDHVMQTVREKRTFSQKCAGCRFFKNCQGGCPALSMLFGGNLLSADDYKCAFFENGYYDKYLEVLKGWKNRNPL